MGTGRKKKSNGAKVRRLGGLSRIQGMMLAVASGKEAAKIG